MKLAKMSNKINNRNILLINSPSSNPSSILSHRVHGLPPLGLAYIATVLNNNDFNAKIVDLYLKKNSLKDIVKAINNCSPVIVGISTTTESYNNGIEIAKYIKKHYNNIIIVMGGYHVTFEYSNAIKTNYVDYIVRGEGEYTFLELSNYLINSIGNIDNIDGISYIDNHEVISNKNREYIKKLDELPFPDRKLFDLEEYSVPSSISTSRGCPNQCIFCAAAGLSGSTYRIRSAKSILEEFLYLKKLGFSHVQIIDDTLTANINRFNEFLDLLIKEKTEMKWSCESRVDIMTKNLLIKMYNAGCVSIQFGVEAGNQEMLDCLKKNITLNQVYDVFKWCEEIGLRSSSCLIIGQPFDTVETIAQTIKIGQELQCMGAQIVFSISTPYPGTDIYNNYEKYNLVIIDDDLDNYTTQKAVYNTKTLTAVEIQNYFFEACLTIGKGFSSDNIIKKYKKVFDEAKEYNSSNKTEK